MTSFPYSLRLRSWIQIIHRENLDLVLHTEYNSF